MQWAIRIWLTLRQSGWFGPGAPGALFPMPLRWQGYAMLAGYILAIVGTLFLSHDPAWAARIALTVGYIGTGILTYR